MWLYAAGAALAYGGISEFMRHAADSAYRAPSYMLSGGPTVALAIPAYEEQKYIWRLLKTARNQTYPVSQIVVADSSDGPETEAVCRDYGAHVVKTQYGNIAASRNAAAQGGRSDILIFSDADVAFCTDTVEKFVSDLQRSLCVHPREVIYDNSLWAALTLVGNNWLRLNNTTRCAALWRDVYDSVGGYDESVNPLEGGGEDVVLGARVKGAYGEDAVAVSNATIATSARRYVKNGVQPIGPDWLPVRNRIYL